MTGNTTLYHRSEGSGEDLVLLHGWGMHSELMSSVGSHLRDRYRVHYLDLPGHGRSPALDRDFDLASLADLLLAQMPAKATVVAWSLGGIAALQMARINPERIQHLALVCSTPQFFQSPHWPAGMAPAVLDAFAEQLQEDYQETVRHFLALSAMGNPGMREQLRQLRHLLFAPGTPDPRALQNGLAILRGSSLLTALGGIHIPTDFIMGGRDRIVHPDCGISAAGALPMARCHVIEQAGHLPFVSHREEFLQRLDTCLQENM